MHGLALPALQTFNTINSNLKFESERVVPLLSIERVLGVLAGWHLMMWINSLASHGTCFVQVWCMVDALFHGRGFVQVWCMADALVHGIGFVQVDAWLMHLFMVQVDYNLIGIGLQQYISQ
jgi:hypothetical protein